MTMHLIYPSLARLLSKRTEPPRASLEPPSAERTMGRGDAAVSSRQKAKRGGVVCCMKRAVSLGTPTPQGKDAFRRATKHHDDPALTNAEGVASGSSESRDGASKSVKDTGSSRCNVQSALSFTITDR